MQKSSINPNILQEMLDSSPNAGDKGQSQFFTPDHLAALIAAPLPSSRLVICDLNAGHGALLRAAANLTTKQVLGADIDAMPDMRIPKVAHDKIQSDLTVLYPLLVDVDWRADLFVLNPPWGLRWHRERLSYLGESKAPAVVRAWLASGREDKDTIDATFATLLIALDRCTACGEGYMLANYATVSRLLSGSFAALLPHIYGHIVLEGNPMTPGSKGSRWNKDVMFKTSLLYFSLGHTAGCVEQESTIETLPSALTYVRSRRRGAEAHEWSACKDTAQLWWSVAAEVQTRQKDRLAFNLWLDKDGLIRTHLSTFEKNHRKLDKAEAVRLSAIDGKRPMQLVIQRAQRDELVHVCERGGWKLCPKLAAAVKNAIKEYHAARHPLQPLPPMRRLGYLDEVDLIVCRADLPRRSPVFKKGASYPVTSQTVSVTRTEKKPNAMTGEMEALLYSGQELCLRIGGSNFMDATNRKTGTVIDDGIVIDFTLQELVDYFVIPEVPILATVLPEAFAANLAFLAELERITDQLTAGQ